MAIGGSKGKTILSEPKEVTEMWIVCVYLQEAGGASFMLQTCRADERTAKDCSVSAISLEDIKRESKGRNEVLWTPINEGGAKTRNITTDEFDLCVVVRIVSTHINDGEKKTFPAYSKLFPMISDTMTFIAGGMEEEEEEGTQIKKNISQHLV